MKKKYPLIKLIIANQLTGLCLSGLIMLMTGIYHHYENSLYISLIFSNSVGFSYYFLFKIYNKFIKNTIEVKTFRSFIFIAFSLLSLFLGSEISYLLITLLLPMNISKISGEFQTILLIINIALIFIVGLFLFVYRNLKKQIELKIIENQKLQQLQTESRLAALQSKITPHFLFNTLNTVLDLVYKSPQKVETIILNLSDIYRKILYSSDNSFYNLEQELKLVQEYLEIEKIRMGNRLEYEFDIDPALENIIIPPLILEPIVENSVIHGISPKITGGKITIKGEIIGDRIILSVSDTGLGIKDSNFKLGFGTFSVKERLNIIFNGNSNFVIKANPDGGTIVVIDIPLEIEKGV